MECGSRRAASRGERSRFTQMRVRRCALETGTAAANADRGHRGDGGTHARSPSDPEVNRSVGGGDSVAQTTIAPGIGADDGNRTRTICLEGRGSTIELHPHRVRNSCVCNQNTIARIARARRPRSSCLRHSPLQSLGFIGETAVVLAGLRACLLARISAFRFAKVAGCKIYFVGV